MVSDYIIVIVKFQYETQKKKNVSNDIRRAFLGLPKGSPNILKTVHQILNSNQQIIEPIHFALIKDPVNDQQPDGSIKIKNPAVGAIVVYEYTGLSQDFDNFINLFGKYLQDFLRNKKHYYLNNCSEIKLLIGKEP